MAAEPIRVLVVDDEPPIVELLRGYLAREGFVVTSVADGFAAVEAVRDQAPEVPVEVVPGITSYSAAAAEALVPLAEGDENLCIVSAAQGADRVARALDLSDNVVVMKSFRNKGEVCDLLTSRGFSGHTVFAAECSRPGAVLLEDLSEIRALLCCYMSFFLVKRPPRVQAVAKRAAG